MHPFDIESTNQRMCVDLWIHSHRGTLDGTMSHLTFLARNLVNFGLKNKLLKYFQFLKKKCSSVVNAVFWGLKD